MQRKAKSCKLLEDRDVPSRCFITAEETILLVGRHDDDWTWTKVAKIQCARLPTKVCGAMLTTGGRKNFDFSASGQTYRRKLCATIGGVWDSSIKS